MALCFSAPPKTSWPSAQNPQEIEIEDDGLATLHTQPTIRTETSEDIPEIRAVVRAAFGQPGEANLIDALRRSGALILSVVAVIDGRVVGHIAFSPLMVAGKPVALALAPMAVAPDSQRQGIGSALIRRALEECRRLGHKVIIVVGEPAYYRRFGFIPASPFGIECPFAVTPDAFMVLELSPGTARACRGMIRYGPEFDAVS
jgi:putative acetyltransferase